MNLESFLNPLPPNHPHAPLPPEALLFLMSITQSKFPPLSGYEWNIVSMTVWFGYCQAYIILSPLIILSRRCYTKYYAVTSQYLIVCYIFYTNTYMNSYPPRQQLESLLSINPPIKDLDLCHSTVYDTEWAVRNQLNQLVHYCLFWIIYLEWQKFCPWLLLINISALLHHSTLHLNKCYSNLHKNICNYYYKIKNYNTKDVSAG